GVPQHVIVAMLDDVAAVDELDLLVAVLEIVREALVDRDRRLRRAALEPGERHLRGGGGCGRGRGLRKRGQGAECAGSRQQGENSRHGSIPPKWRNVDAFLRADGVNWSERGQLGRRARLWDRRLMSRAGIKGRAGEPPSWWPP